MPKQIIIAEQHQIAAIFSEDRVQEFVVSTGTQQVGDIYVGTVENVIPGIDAAFVNIGDAERNGFMHVTDLGPLRLRRSAGAITELLTPNQKVLVQVMKEPTGNKGPRLTGNITLPGRYLVLMPYGRGVNLSRRIKNEGERSRLRALAILIKPSGMGLLVRTEAEGKDEEAVIEDLEYLKKQWEDIQQQANVTRPPALLNRDDDFIQRVLRDIYSADVNRIVADSSEGVKRVKQHLKNWSGGRSPEGVLIDHHRDRQPILEYFRVNAAILEALKPRVDLPSGGYVIIEPTEALTVIDVNSGSFTRSATARETVLWTNNEAATEIARQLRLRNIGGVIVVDFIDMDSRRDQLALLETFNDALSGDKARPQIAQLSELGLVELTRKRQGQNIYELFGKECPTCSGLGHVANLPGMESASEVIEKSLPVIPAPTPKIAEKREDDLEGLLDLGVEDNPQELDLLNHPSYQDQNLTGNRRRRRRRVGDEAPSKSAKIRLNGGNGRNGDSEEELPVVPDTLDRYERRAPRRETPPEKVSVEMTPLEQDVYALMGISPLVRVDREVKDPRSVILSISEPESSEEDWEGEEEFKIEVAPISIPEEEEQEPISATIDEVEEPPSDETEDSDEEADNRPLIRRRRRRSSAQ
ncbi:MAG: Rne/Rng family ribonuclease [Cyanobacteria bacterium SBLK]|nr:Rne/Rng family ribonuclease [Cyanobacteria bacterium SBLK]